MRTGSWSRRPFVGAVAVVGVIGLLFWGCVGTQGEGSNPTTALSLNSAAASLRPTVRGGETTGTSGDRTDGTSVDVVVPAGGSMDVPVDFEGSTEASLTLSATTTGITASFAGTALPSGTAAGHSILQLAPIQNPTNGTVHIVNPGSTDSTVTVTTSFFTNRHLTITPSASTVTAGTAVPFTVSLSGASGSEGASAYLVDPNGTQTPITLTSSGPGTWTGQVTPTVAGANKIDAQTTGDRPRSAEHPLSVGSGAVTIAPGFTEQLVDENGDGLADKLRVTMTVTNARAAKYTAAAYLLNSTGAKIDSGVADVQLQAGSQQVSIDFSGDLIYRSGLSGPYRIGRVWFLDDKTYLVEGEVAELGLTQTYDLQQFQH